MNSPIRRMGARVAALILLLSACSVFAADSAKTVPLIPASEQGKSLSFLVLGDWGRRGNREQTKVATQMGIYAEKLHSSFTIAVGDNFYEWGVKSVTDSHWKESFEDVYTAPSLQKRWYVALGNHDYFGVVQAQIDYTKQSARWYLPARYYAETVSIDDTTQMLLLVYDSSPFIKGYQFSPIGDMRKEVESQDTTVQLKWMDSILTHSRAQWKIMVAHHPVYSAGQHGDNKVLINHILPLIKKYHVQVYLAGHDHDLQHLIPSDEITSYFVSGGGAEARKIHENPALRFGAGIAGFMAATISSRELQMNFIDYQGKILYTAKVSR